MKKGFLVLLLLASVSHAHEEDAPINSALELRDWCERESQAWFIGQGTTPYNWSASYWEEGNMFLVKGEWLAGNKHAVVECRVARGAQARYAQMAVR